MNALSANASAVTKVDATRTPVNGPEGSAREFVSDVRQELRAPGTREAIARAAAGFSRPSR